VPAGIQKFTHVPPVHANVVNGAADAELSQQAQAGSEKGEELRFSHLTGGHLEFSVSYRTVSADISVDRDIIWRVDKDDRGAFFTK